MSERHQWHGKHCVSQFNLQVVNSGTVIDVYKSKTLPFIFQEYNIDSDIGEAIFMRPWQVARDRDKAEYSSPRKSSQKTL